MTRAILAALMFCAVARAQQSPTNAAPETAAVTNVFLVSDVATSKAWTRQAVLATPSNTIKDLSGVFVAAAEAAVHSNEAERIQAVSTAAIEGMRSAFSALYAVTGNISRTAYHVAISLPPNEGGKSLRGYVVKETTDGVTDTQWVWYSHALPIAPVRYVEYVTPSGSSTASAKWVNWTESGETLTIDGRTWNGCHKCTITRPQAARSIPALTRQNERFGGAGGFDFGAALVTVGGRATFTGAVTNDITGEVLVFNNGVLKKGESNASEE
jgi:hypothetical protein